MSVRWEAEIIKPLKEPHFRSALFDFDGTVSLIRSGWQEIMNPYFIEVIKATGTNESHTEIAEIVREFVDRLTGKQTIYQCIALDEEVVKRGGKHVDPLEYKHEYLRRLNEHIKDRKKGLENGTLKKEDLIVPGSIEFVRKLRAAGVKCYVASGTDEKDVIYEASLLGLDEVFEGEIYGAKDEVMDCSKEIVINSLINDGGIKPEELVCFGDGYVEIELVANIGGYAVGVASDEEKREGINEWKRERLLSAGASMIIPDFSKADSLIDYLIGGKNNAL